MKKLLLVLAIISNALAHAQIKVDTSFGNANVEVVQIAGNNLFFRAKLRKNQTENIWFYFKAFNLNTDTLNLRYLPANPLYMPYSIVFSFDNKTWKPLSPVTRSPNLQTYKIPVRKHDSVFIATYYPYTYATLLKLLDSLDKLPFVRVTNLITSEHGYSVPLVIISAPENDSLNKDLVWITARQHAFETPSSFCMQGILKYLSSNDSLVAQLRNNVIFYIVPMMDVDNVILGNSGRMQKPVDFNRDWGNKSHWNAVSATKDLLDATTGLHNFRIFIDIHSVFPFSAEPNLIFFNLFKQNSEQYANLQEFWNIYSLLDSMPLEISDFTQKKYADLYIKQKYPYVDFSMTLECPWNRYNGNTTVQTPGNLENMGKNFAKALVIYLSQNYTK